MQFGDRTTLLGALAFVLSAGCASAPPPESAALPPEPAPVMGPALPTAPPHGAATLTVQNVCSASGTTYSFQARIDAKPDVGGQRPPASHILWSVACKDASCRGTKLDLDPWLEGRPLDSANLTTMDGVEFVKGSPSEFTVKWGPRTFHVDLSRSQVDFDESGSVRQSGTAPCSSAGSPWPDGGH
jgi:hypothetical protein